MPVVQYKCPNCSADLKFNPYNQSFVCEYCQSSFTEDEIKAAFKNTNESINLNENVDEQNSDSDDFNEHTNLYNCPSCGAQIITDETTSATFCVYCHNPVILSGRLSGNYKPSKIIPFQIDKDGSTKIFKKWCSKRWFLPKSFKSAEQLEKLVGIYVPFWIADCGVNAYMDANCKKIRTWTSGNYDYKETKEYEVVRDACIKFTGVPADGASKIEDTLMQAIEPFDYTGTKPFSMSYLSGFQAEKYDVDQNQVFPIIKSRISSGSSDILKKTIIGYDVTNVATFNLNVLKTDWQYMLMPVWFMTYKYKDKYYSLAENGQTGKIAGTPPLSIGKLLGFCGIMFAGITAIIMVILYFLTSGGFII